jgi:hypothetical protein
MKKPQNQNKHLKHKEKNMKKKPSNRTIQKLNQKIDRLKQMETNLNSCLSKQYIGISVQEKRNTKYSIK